MAAYGAPKLQLVVCGGGRTEENQSGETLAAVRRPPSEPALPSRSARDLGAARGRVGRGTSRPRADESSTARGMARVTPIRLSHVTEAHGGRSKPVGALPPCWPRRTLVLIRPRPVCPFAEAGRQARPDHSHSMVAGGFEEISSATRFTCGTSLMMRLEIVWSTSYGMRAQSAVIASSEVTARITIGCA